MPRVGIYLVSRTSCWEGKPCDEAYEVEMMDAIGCEECGTDDNKCESVTWKTHKEENLLTAIKKLKAKLGV